MILMKVLAAALLTLWFSNVTTTPYTVQAQGSIGQPAGDPTGATTGTAADVTVKDPKNPTLPEVMETVGHNKIAINFVWTLLAGFLVMFMQAGFAMVETGFTRAKNAAHTMSMNFMIYPIGMLGYWVCGYALQMGGVGAVSVLGGTAPLNSEFTISLFGHTFGLFGMNGFFLSGNTYDVGVFALFLFQMVFMDTAGTIPTGAMAERWKWSAFVVFGFFMSMVVYPLFANWVWGGGWLATLGKEFGLGHGHVDFAGSSVVHMVGGMAALAGAIVLGPRLGKYTKSGESVAMPGHDIPMALAGTFILAFGWFGFNPGSTLAGWRPSHRGRRDEYDAGRDRRRRLCDVLCVEAPRQTRPEHAGERHAGRTRCHHGSMCVRQQRLGGDHRRHRRISRRRIRPVLRPRGPD
jgi:hypothetical protein